MDAPFVAEFLHSPPSNRETTLVKSESYANLGVERYKTVGQFDHKSILSIFRIIVVGFILGLASSPALGSWLDLQY